MEKSLKECGKCFEFLNINEFGTDKKTKDGKKRFCKQCISDLNRNNYLKKSDQKKEQILNWQALNTEKVKEYKRSYAKRKRKKRG